MATVEQSNPVTYPERVYDGKYFVPNLNREQSSDKVTTILTDTNEVLGFPDHTSQQEMQSAIEADHNGSISTYKPTFYDKFIRQPLQNMGFASFQPTFVSDIKPTPERAFATSMAEAATVGVFKPEFVEKEAQAFPLQAKIGVLVGGLASFATGGALLNGWKLTQLTPFAEGIVKTGLLGGVAKGIAETSEQLRDSDHPELAKIGTGVLHDTLWFGAMGATAPLAKTANVAASAGLGYLMAKTDGQDEPSALLNGALFGGIQMLHVHGDNPDVRDMQFSHVQQVISDYIVAKNPMVHLIVADQAGREMVDNYAQDVLDRKFSRETNVPLTEEEMAQQKMMGEGSPVNAIDEVSKDKGLSLQTISNIAKDVSGIELKEGTKEQLPIEGEGGGQQQGGLQQEQAKPEDLKAIYHGTDKLFNEFDIKKSADGTIWFTDNKSKIEGGEVSATGKGQIITRFINENKLKLGNYDDADKYSTDELINMGYDGLKLVDKDQTTYQIFNPEKLQKEGEPNATQRGKGTQEGSQQAQKLDEGTQGSVRVRDNEEGRVEAKQGEEIVKETTGERVTSKIAKSIEQKAVDAKLTNKFETLAGEEKVNVEEQSKMATDLVNSKMDDARAIIRGEKPLPDRLRGISLITAMEEHLKNNPDGDIAEELANSPLVSGTTRAAQELRLAAEREPDSFTQKMKEINQAKIDAAGGQEKANKEIQKRVKIYKTEISKLNLSKDELNWEKFLDKEVAC